MALNISGLNELRERLERLRAEEVMARALTEQAARMAARVREGLSEPPGGGGHDEPWLRSGALRDSVGAQADGLQAAVGSSDLAAVPQELGTARTPARPFLAPVAAGMGEEVARAVAAAVVAVLRGDSPDAGSARVDLCGDGPDGSNPLYGGAIAGVGTLRTHDGSFMLASGKADGKDDPLRELRKDLGEETPEEEEEEIEHGKFNPLHVHGIPPGGGALPFGPGRLDAGSSPPAPRTASPQPSPPPAWPTAPGAAPTGQSPAPAMPNPTPDWISPEVRSRVPPGWGEGGATNKGEGWRWTDPENQGNGVRIDRGNPNNSQPVQQQDHVIVRSGGRVIGRDGQPIEGSVAQNAEQAHIPLSEYQGWTTWNHP